MSEKINSSTKLWSEECREADPTPEERPAYEFSNGRRFDEPRQ